MSMSLLMVQPLVDAGKNATAGAGSKGQGNDAGNPFQALLDGRMVDRTPERAPVSASDTPAETVSDAASPAAQPEKKDAETESASASGQVGEEKETASAEQDEKGDVQAVSGGEAAVLAQIMAAMGGVQQVQAESAAASGEDVAVLADENGVPVLSAVSGEAAEDGLPLPVMADAGGGGAQGRQEGKDDGSAYARVQAEAGQKAVDADDRLPAAEEPEVSGKVNAVSVDAEKTAAPTAAATTVSAAATVSSGTGEARQLPVSQQGALPVSSEQAVFMQPIQPVAQAVATAAPANTVPVEARIMQPMGTPEWNQAIGQRVLWMVGQEQQSASLTLNPPDLGPVRVVVSVSNNHASANFFSANPDVRQALEGSLPRLREMMEGAGIQLGQAQVGAENSGGFQQGSGASGRTADNGGGGNGLEGEGGSLAGVAGAGTTGGAQPVQVVSKGLVDTFV